MIKLKSLLISVCIPLFLGILSGAITYSSLNSYNMIIKPKLSPPGIVFPIVWSILYILMGISCYMIYESKSKLKSTALTLYAVQLLFNFFWPIIFFGFSKYLFAFLWVFILLILVVLMTAVFSKINKIAGILQIPYIVWLVFANYLSFAVYLLN